MDDENQEAESEMGDGYLDDVKSEETQAMKEDAIYYYTKVRKGRGKVPPPTPIYDINYERTFKTLPEVNVDDLNEVPRVRDGGIKFCIEHLGQKFGMPNYEYDLIQFWFLDILTDCLWKSQEVFSFDEDQQKTILNWVMAFFKIIADPTLGLTRKQFLAFFKEVLLKVYDEINKMGQLPNLELLEEIIRTQVGQDQEDEYSVSESTSSSSNPSLSTFTIKTSDKIRICPDFDIKEHIRQLKQNNPLSNAYHKYSDVYVDNYQEYFEGTVEEIEDETFDDQSSFYKSDYSTPSRFKSSNSDNMPVAYTCQCKYNARPPCICVDHPEDLQDYQPFYPFVYSMRLPNRKEDQLHLKSESNQILNYLVGNTLPHSVAVEEEQSLHSVKEKVEETLAEKVAFEASEPLQDEEERLLENEIVKEWAYFNLMEQRIRDMNDPKVGWVPWASPSQDDATISVDESSMSTTTSEFTIKSKEDHLVTLKMLQAIIDFVFEYFYENFHFTLIKLAFRSNPLIMTHRLNKVWPVPKEMKSEFKRPKESPKKKEKKPKKEQRDKKKKDKKSDKKSKASSKKSKKSDKSSKKKKGDKSSKSSKGKPKKTPLTKEELEELERQRLEQEMLDEQKRKAIENELYMFPLADAASEELFVCMFGSWIQIADKTTKNDKKGKQKKEKAEAKKSKKKKK